MGIFDKIRAKTRRSSQFEISEYGATVREVRTVNANNSPILNTRLQEREKRLITLSSKEQSSLANQSSSDTSDRPFNQSGFDQSLRSYTFGDSLDKNFNNRCVEGEYGVVLVKRTQFEGILERQPSKSSSFLLNQREADVVTPTPISSQSSKNVPDIQIIQPTPSPYKIKEVARSEQENKAEIVSCTPVNEFDQSIASVHRSASAVIRAKKGQFSWMEGNLFNPDILAAALVQSSPRVSIDDLPDDLYKRPLSISDYNRGYPNLLTHLTHVGHFDYFQWKERFGQMQQHPHAYYVVVIAERSSEHVVATASLVLEWKIIHELGHRGRIEDVVVDPSRQNQKLGKHLIGTLTLLAQHLQCYKVSLECKDHLIRFYGRHGYLVDEGNNFLVQRFDRPFQLQNNLVDNKIEHSDLQSLPSASCMRDAADEDTRDESASHLLCHHTPNNMERSTTSVYATPPSIIAESPISIGGSPNPIDCSADVESSIVTPPNKEPRRINMVSPTSKITFGLVNDAIRRLDRKVRKQKAAVQRQVHFRDRNSFISNGGDAYSNENVHATSAHDQKSLSLA